MRYSHLLGMYLAVSNCLSNPSHDLNSLKRLKALEQDLISKIDSMQSLTETQNP